MLLHFEAVLHDLLIPSAVSLGPERVNRRPFSPVQHAVLNAGLIGRLSHFPTEGIQLPHQMALAGPPDRRVAGHVADAVQIDREADSIHAETRGRKCGLDPGMSCPYDGNLAAARLKCFDHDFT